jgi:hypothetical protein
MEWIQHFLAAVNDYMQTGFYKVNAIQGLLIAMGAAYVLPKWNRLFVVALGATLVYVVFDIMIPVLARNAAFKLPPLVDVEYWRYVLALYIGFLIIIPVFFLAKVLLLRSAVGH